MVVDFLIVDVIGVVVRIDGEPIDRDIVRLAAVANIRNEDSTSKAWANIK